MNETNPFAPQGDANDPVSAGADATRALLPCPFCGGEPDTDGPYQYAPDARWWVKCHDCEAEIHGMATEAEAAAAWNRRLAAAPANERLQAHAEKLLAEYDNLDWAFFHGDPKIESWTSKAAALIEAALGRARPEGST